METYPLWKDLYFETDSASTEYRIIIGGTTEIFHGTAHASPQTGLIRIKVNDICASYLDSALDGAELLRGTELDTYIPSNGYNEFSLETYNISRDRWDTAMEWAFINDTSYEPWRSGGGLYSEPINSHGAPGQMLAASYLILDPSNTICHNGIGIYFIITRGAAEELADTGGTWEIDYDTNLENAYYEMRRAASHAAPVTGYTSGGTISFTLSGSTDVFDEEYETVFYSEPGGTRLGTAVAYIGGGEGGGFTHFLRIKNAPSYISSAGTMATFEYATNCDGQIKYELSSSSTQYTGYRTIQTGTTGNFERITLRIPANPEYEPRYYRMEIYGSDSTDPYTYLVSDYTDFEQQDRQHYFYFTTQNGLTLPWSSTTNTITWATDYNGINYELIRDNNFVSSGTSTTGGAMLTFPQNDTLNTITYTLNAFTTGGTPLGAITFYHLDEAGDYAFEYFGIQALSAGTIGITSTHDPAYTLEYSKNNAEWIPISTTANSLNVATIGINAGDRVRFRGDTYPYSVTESGRTEQGLHFVISGTPCEIYGNILSLTYGDDFSGATAPHGQGNYAYLFASTCKALKSAKNLFLPAPYANDYEGMFIQCTGLTTPPKIASVTAPGSYNRMFQECRSLEYAPSLWATTAEADSYFGMFQGCTGLTAAPVISATTINARACKNMFEGCSGLTQAPALNATTVGDNGYDSMFKGCRSLTAPAQWAYNGGGTEACAHMYSGCTALLSTPPLPAADSVRVYYGMFEGCTSLTTTQSALTCTGDAWTEAFMRMFAGCISLTAAPSISGIYAIPQGAFNGMFSGCSGLTSAPAFPNSYAVLAPACFQSMFEGCSGLTQAPALPWTAITENCYNGMFRWCENLTAAPSLPATTLAPGCYAAMFQGCARLTTAPILRAATIPSNAYAYMFNWCSLLDYIECLATDISAEDSTLYFAYRTKGTGVFMKSSSMSGWEYGPNGIPEGWTIENA